MNIFQNISLWNYKKIYIIIKPQGQGCLFSPKFFISPKLGKSPIRHALNAS